MNCHSLWLQTKVANKESILESKDWQQKRYGGKFLKLAVAYKEGEIFRHFEHSKWFKVCEIDNGEIVGLDTIDMEEAGYPNPLRLLVEYEIDAVICERIEDSALNMLAEEGILVYSGISGEANRAIRNFIDGNM